MNLEEVKMNELVKELSKRFKENEKKNKGLTKLVCYLRREFDYAVKMKDGMTEEFDLTNKNMVKAYDIMMEVEHDREMARRDREQAKAEKELSTGDELE